MRWLYRFKLGGSGSGIGRWGTGCKSWSLRGVDSIGGRHFPYNLL